MLGLLITALGYGLLSLTDLLPGDLRAAWLLTTNIIGALGSAVYLVNTGPFLAEVTQPADRARALSTQVAIWPLAGFIGSLIGGAAPDLIAPLIGVVPSDPATYRYTMFVAALAVLPGLLALRGTRVEPPAARPADYIASRAPNRLIAQIALAISLQVGAEGVVITFFNVYLDRGLQVPITQIGLLLAFARLASVPAALFTPLLLRRWGLRRTMIAASLGVVLSVLPLALIPHWVAAEAGLLSLTCLAAVARSAITTYTMEVVDAPWRGRISAATTMGVGLSWSALSLAGGYAIAVLGFPPLFLAGAACTLTGVALLTRIPAERRERSLVSS
jgi:MFS family permease